jgi:hypothetical protein
MPDTKHYTLKDLPEEMRNCQDTCINQSDENCSSCYDFDKFKPKQQRLF